MKGFGGMAMVIETTAPQLVEPDEFEAMIHEKLWQELNFEQTGPAKIMMAPWGEETEVREATHKYDGRTEKCITWSNHRIVPDKITPEGAWVSGKLGAICAEQPYEFLDAVVYK